MILLTPHAQGLFVYVDGAEHFKPMTTNQMLTLAERVIEAAIASNRGEGWDVAATEVLK